tara:strand:+ start:85 stop:672 length:588 start_codon:yes stop_codon:yes gene_type:complete
VHNQEQAAFKIMASYSITKNERQLYIKQKDKANFNSAEEEFEYALGQEKQCSKCGVMKTLTEYGGNTSGCDAFDKSGFRLRRPECKDCTRKANSGKNEAKKLAEKMGIPYKAPHGTKCAICGKPEKKGDGLVFDHCHITNTFRGYLHNSCNRSIGVLGDNVEGLLNVVNFLNNTENRIIIQDNNGKMNIKRRNSF